ncbi:MAG: DUF2971 domain-containing protein [Chlorobiaceae bacterium]|nr:DUF2971 domain-containing protein [Chlorobiaceae bacterium]
MATLMSKPKDVLYHYCSTEAFHSIVTTHSIRLSSLSLSNDSMEGKMVAEALARLAECDKRDQGTISLLQKQFEVYLKDVDGFGFCLSKQRDQLSKWRGYADDATGVAIGFSQEYLEFLREEYSRQKFPFLGFTIAKVIYDPKVHDDQVRPLYQQFKQAIDEGHLLEAKKHSLLRSGSNDSETQRKKSILASIGFSSLMATHAFAFVLKSEAFKEEAEWRLLALITRGEIKNLSCGVKSDRLRPFREYELKKFAQVTPVIKEVILGPKHRTPISVVEDFLRCNGFGYVQVSCSAAPYQ